mmetsp:Transcript_33885/g.65950  ORF Transcript_33885/g.65950 Transcript_33885/m.65950 type:complete len:159 (+) Transcript_33885:101-577(+)
MPEVLVPIHILAVFIASRSIVGMEAAHEGAIRHVENRNNNSREGEASSQVAKRVMKAIYKSTYNFLPTSVDSGMIFRDYVIADFKGQKRRIGLRWRTRRDVMRGKGKEICGNQVCEERHGLGSYEVNFIYIEKGKRNQALVKIRLCRRCSKKLNRRVC